MCKKVYVVMSHFASHSKIEGVFSCYEYAEKFRELPFLAEVIGPAKEIII